METGTIVNIALIVLAAIMAITAITGVGLSASGLAKLGKAGSGSGSEIKDKDMPTPPPAPGRSESESKDKESAVGGDKNIPQVNMDDLVKESLTIHLGICVPLFLFSVLQIVICVLLIMNIIKFLIWIIVNSVCGFVYIVAFVVLCYYYAGIPIKGAALTYSLIAFSGLCGVVTIAMILFLHFSGAGGNAASSRRSKKSRK